MINMFLIVLASVCTAAIVFLVYILPVSREIKALTKQIEFITENRTVKRITCGVSCCGISGLCDALNAYIDESRKNELHVKRTDDALRETIANLSHDIRTPLTSLCGYFDELCVCSDVSGRKRICAIVKRKIDTLRCILDELFDYAKLQDKDFSLGSEKVNMTELIYSSAFDFYDQFTAAGIDAALDICDEKLIINANYEGVSRIAQNIIKNALVHSTASDGRVKISLRKSGGEAVFSCENRTSDPDGIDVERIFERFYKADKARSSASSGLGLAIASALTEKMSGRIFAEVQDDIFRITVLFAI